MEVGKKAISPTSNNNKMGKVDESAKNDGIWEYLYGHKVTYLSDVGPEGVEVEF
jgi:hypothetical protein